MSGRHPVTVKYLADIAGVSPELVGRYAAMLRDLVADGGGS